MTVVATLITECITAIPTRLEDSERTAGAKTALLMQKTAQDRGAQDIVGHEHLMIVQNNDTDTGSFPYRDAGLIVRVGSNKTGYWKVTIDNL